MLLPNKASSAKVFGTANAGADAGGGGVVGSLSVSTTMTTLSLDDSLSSS